MIQGDTFNRSALRTVVCVPLTSNIDRAESPGNVLLGAKITGLPDDSVALIPQVVAIDRSFLGEAVGRLSQRELNLLFRIRMNKIPHRFSDQLFGTAGPDKFRARGIGKNNFAIDHNAYRFGRNLD